MKVQPSKCALFKQELKFLGHTVSAEGVRVNEEKTSALRDRPLPSTAAELRSWGGAIGFFRKFIPNYSKRAAPLRALMEGVEERNMKRTKLNWTRDALLAYSDLTQAVCSAPCLAYPNFDEPFEVQTDASTSGLGACLLTKAKHDGQWHPVAFASRALSKSERFYPAHKLEFLAMTWALADKFKDYLAHSRLSRVRPGAVYFRQLSLYCLVDEVLRRGEIMPDEKKKLTFHSFFIFSSDMPKNQGIFFPKLHKFQLNLFIFTIKSHFPTFFYFFLRPESKY